MARSYLTILFYSKHFFVYRRYFMAGRPGLGNAITNSAERT